MPLGSAGLDRTLKSLIILISETERNVLAFAIYSDIETRERIRLEVSEKLEIPIKVFILSADKKNPFDLIEAPGQPARSCVFFFNVEEAFPEFLGYVNLQRERLLGLAHATVFWVRQEGLRRIAESAPDFWAWRSGVFDFRVEAPPEVRPFLPVMIDRDVAGEIALYEDLIANQQDSLAALAGLEVMLGRLLLAGGRERTEAVLRSALEHAREAGDVAIKAEALELLGQSATRRGDYAVAERLYREALDAAGRIQDKPRIGRSLRGLGWTMLRLGLLAEARQVAQKSVAVFRELGDAWELAASLLFAGAVAIKANRHSDAVRPLSESLEVKDRLGVSYLEAPTLANLGFALIGVGDNAGATQYLQRARELYEENRNHDGAAMVRRLLESIAASRREEGSPAQKHDSSSLPDR